MRLRTPLCASALLLLAAPLARADSLLDRPAPDPAVAKWVVGEPPPSWKALKGRCALLELTDPDDIVSQGLESRTAELAARGAARKLLVVTVAVGTAVNEGTARSFADSFRITWPLGVDRKGETFVAAGLPTLPRHFLIAPDGRVLWEGSPGALDNATLDGFLDRARLWRPEEVAKMLRPAAELFVRGKYGAAAKKVAETLAEVKKRQAATLPLEGTEEKDARLVLDAVESMARIRLGIADGLAKERWSIDAKEIYEGVAAAFAGTEWEGRAKEGLAAMAADKRAQYEILAMKRLRDILAAIRPLTRQTLRHALDEIDNFLLTFENTVSGERARGEKARLGKLLQGL